MQAAQWRLNQTAMLSRRRATGRRDGFTLVEMMVTVTLVLLMMLMFAEIYSLAQETMSKQKGMAENDQRARILMEVVRSDLQARTFRSVYPFKLENPTQFTGTPMDAAMLDLRRGYFHYSENDTDDSTDDVLQLTVDVAGKGGHPGRRIFGKAAAQSGLTAGMKDGPEFDDGREGDVSGSSSTAEVAYFLRNGNLYRSVLLVRQPYLAGYGITNVGLATPPGFPGSPGTAVPPDPPLYSTTSGFWNDYDFSAYRDTEIPGSGVDGRGVRFHGPDSLSNNADSNVVVPPHITHELYGRGVDAIAEVGISQDGQPGLFLPRSLGAPQLRYGFSVTAHGQPFEFAGNYDYTALPASRQFFGRFTAQERSYFVSTSNAFGYPGINFSPMGLTSAGVNGLTDPPAPYRSGPRRGIDLMLPNVLSFDVQIWDDVLRRFVDIGYGIPTDLDPNSVANVNDGHSGFNPYTATGTREFGFYHLSRLRSAMRTGGTSYLVDYTDPAVIPNNFGNRFDTWSPNMWIQANQDPNDNTAMRWRTGRAPYRPLKRNPDPNQQAFNDTYEPTIVFGDLEIANLGDTTDDAEAPVRAIRIVVRYLDPQSGQTRQATIEQSLVD